MPMKNINDSLLEEGLIVVGDLVIDGEVAATDDLRVSVILPAASPPRDSHLPNMSFMLSVGNEPVLRARCGFSRFDLSIWWLSLLQLQ